MPRFDRGRGGRSRSPMRRFSSNRGGGQRKGKFDMDMGFTAPRFNLAELPRFEKCFYVEHPASSNRTESEVSAFRALHKMSLNGTNIPRPAFSFAELNLPDYITRVVVKNGWQNPTPIQAQGIPMGLGGRDVVGIAQTGSGKTASFIIPAIVHIAAQPRLLRGDGPVCLVLVPTRELAQQVLVVAQEFASSANMRTMCFYGGSSRAPQLRDLKRGAEICIATPGRLIDFIKSESKLMSRVTFLVLDEADRMLDMGFEPQIRKIVAHIRPDRQTLMWSATWPKEVQTLARDFLSNYIQVNIGSISLHANPNITQIVEVVDEWCKEQRLIELLTMFGRSRCLVFVETKRKTDQITYTLRRRGFAVGAMHGDKQQKDRETTLSNFREGRINVLVATDVASRGLDIDDIEYIINVDFPNQTEDYIHRIGRTARSDKKGTAFTFFASKNMKQARELIDILEEANQEVNPELYRMSGATDSRKGNFRRKNQPVPSSKPPVRYGHSSMNSNALSGVSRFTGSEVRPPLFGMGSTGFQNGSSMHKSNSASGSLHGMANEFPSASKQMGLLSDNVFAGARETQAKPTNMGYPNFGANQPQIDIRVPENSFNKPTQPTMRPTAPSNASSGGAGRWDRHAPTLTGVNQGLQNMNDQTNRQPPSEALSNTVSNSWGGRQAAKVQEAWDPTFQAGINRNMPTQVPNQLRRPSTETNPGFTHDVPGGMSSRGSSGNLKNTLLPSNPPFPQSWSGFPQQQYSQNPPPAAPPSGQPGAPVWGAPNWAQPYYGNFQ